MKQTTKTTLLSQIQQKTRRKMTIIDCPEIKLKKSVNKSSHH
ncbi:hypothetical protein ACN08N_00170 (plasmid) [Photobacterium leiognathi subsp. mandapamensis]